jgi:ubiquinone/menaquinone biosynthesis C-methylase UbiE
LEGGNPPKGHAMSKQKRVTSKDAGLGIGLILGKYFFKTVDMHYGYWTDDLDVDIANLPRAQEQHSNFIISHMPEGVKTVLDVGCGAGVLARRLLDKGYQVDCVSPSVVLTEEARKVLGDKIQIYQCKFEELDSDREYDVVLFSESFQYVHLDKALQQSLRFLKSGGHLLICDFFQTDAQGKSPLGGGHKLSKFYSAIGNHPFEKTDDIDITDQTAPNLKITNDIMLNVLLPIWVNIRAFLKSRHPWLSKILLWRFKKRIEKINRKYFRGERNAENFRIFKSYRFLLYKKV